MRIATFNLEDFSSEARGRASLRERVAALRAFREIASRAVVAYYPGWDWKNRFRRLRARLGLPVRKLREHIPPHQLEQEAQEAGWRLAARRQVFPVLSENVLLTLIAP